MITNELKVSGDGVVKGNLRIEGWLEAPNIKGFLKGLFATTEDLFKMYPRPRTGWAALVGDTLPAAVYTASDGVWHATGETAGAVLLPSQSQGNESTGDSGSAQIDAETANRIKGDLELFQALNDVAGYHKMTPSWTYRTYIDFTGNTVTGASLTGYCISAPIHLEAGECLALRCDTNGVAYPISEVGNNRNYLHPVGTSLSKGMTDYRFTAEIPTTVQISCYGEAESVRIWRRTEHKVMTRLISANGNTSDGTGNDGGAILKPDGSIEQNPRYGISASAALPGISRIRYRGQMFAPSSGANAFILFYDSAGKAARAHYCGTDTTGNSGNVAHATGVIDTTVTIPAAAVSARFCYAYSPGTVANPVFEVILCP